MFKTKAIQQFALFGLMAGLVFAFSSSTQAQGQLRGGTLRGEDRVRPGTWDHVDELAVRLAKLSQDLHDEIHVHLEGHPYFRHMDGHAEEIEELSEHIHDLAHDGGNIRHLREDVVKLDSEVHHADELITKIAQRGVRREHFHGGIRVTRSIVDEMLDILHHLEDDLVAMDPTYRRAGYRDYDVQDIHDHRRPSEQFHDRYPSSGYPSRYPSNINPHHHHSHYHMR